jgi:hypothetical protein
VDQPVPLFFAPLLEDIYEMGGVVLQLRTLAFVFIVIGLLFISIGLVLRLVPALIRSPPPLYVEVSKADIEYLLGSKTVVLDVPVQETLDIGASSSIPIPLHRASALPPLLNGNSIKTSLPLPGLTAPKLFSSAFLEQFQTEETQ